MSDYNTIVYKIWRLAAIVVIAIAICVAVYNVIDRWCTTQLEIAKVQSNAQNKSDKNESKD